MRPPPGARAPALLLAVALIAVTGCASGHRRDPGGKAAPSTAGTVKRDAPPATAQPLPGMPPPLAPGDVYAADRPGKLSPAVRHDPALVYVPNSGANTVDVIDQRTRRAVRHFATGAEPQHVTPSWDLRRLWVGNDKGNSLTPIDPRTGKAGRRVRVADPYNLYFTPDGRFAVVVAERLGRLDFRDPRTMALRHSLRVPCRGVDHMDFSAGGTYAIATCEFSGQLLKVGIAGGIKGQRVLGTLRLRGRRPMPQDVKLSPDGRVFYVADMAAGGVWLVGGDPFKVLDFVATGRGAHGLYASRDSKVLYVSNRSAGSISVLSFATRKVVATWHLPRGGSPDMGGISADGKVLWLSGRYDRQVYAIDTRSGRLLARIPVGAGPHGLCVWPQPGRYSLGHTGILR
ncbi:MAG TPA: YncE family protein [Actinomycetes bacterium]|nr:YncE family protein [Actinomycetes bacterium]